MDLPKPPLFAPVRSGLQRFINGTASPTARLFSADTRSLALFRVGLALLLLADLATRAPFLTAFYTDRGVMPRSFVTDHLQDAWSFSLHLASGQVYVQAFLFVCAGLAALLLLVGYKTRLFTFLSWALLASLHVRNPEVLSSGDILLRVLLFWGLFLPLGLHWSIDRARATNEQGVPERVLSAATAAVLVQAASVYLFTWLLKTGGPWRDGSAVRLALNWDQGTTWFGRALLETPPGFLALATHGVVLFELLGPLLLFAPVFTARVRLVLLPLFVLMHLTFGVAMVLGTFPFVSAVSLIPFLPTAFWGAFRGGGRGVTVFYDGGCSFCYKMVRLLRTFLLVPHADLRPAQEDAAASVRLTRETSWVVRDGTGDHTRAAALRVLLCASPVGWPLYWMLGFGPFLRLADAVYMRLAARRPAAGRALRWLRPGPLRWRLPLAAQLAAGALLVGVFVWNLAGVLHFTMPLTQPLRALHLQQNWGMFAPYPRLDDGWYVAEGQLVSGERVDVFRAVIAGSGEALSYSKPEPVSASLGGVYWTKYFEHLLRSEDKGRYALFASFLCREWNAAHPEARRLGRFDLYFMLEHTERLNEPPEKIHLWWQTC